MRGSSPRRPPPPDRSGRASIRATRVQEPCSSASRARRPTAAGSRLKRLPPEPGECSPRLSTPKTPGAHRPGCCSRRRTRCEPCRSWPRPGATDYKPTSSASPARPARPRPRTSCKAILTPHRRTVAEPRELQHRDRAPAGDPERATSGTEVLVLEMAMRGRGQIAELAQIAEPDIGIIVSIGPVHLELLGSIEAIAATKAELDRKRSRPSGTAIIPADEPLLEPHTRTDIRTVTFGPGGDVRADTPRARSRPSIDDRSGDHARSSSTCRSPRPICGRNLLAAVAAAQAIGVTPSGYVDLALSAGRGQRIELPQTDPADRRLLQRQPDVDARRPRRPRRDRRAARQQPTRRVAVLGDMLELGPDERRFHEEIGAYANARRRRRADHGRAPGGGDDEHVHRRRSAHDRTTPPRPRALTAKLLQPGDTVLVKASRGVGLELVCGALQTAEALA